MAKAIKVQTCDDRCDDEHDNESESDNDDELTKDELIDMLEDTKEHFDIKRRECKDLRKEIKALKQAFDELNVSHDRLEEAHEKLDKAHKKLEKAHSSLLNEQNEKEHVVTCDKGLTCDIIDESFYKPIIVAATNPFCSTFTSTSSSSDSFTYDASLMVENETLKKEVKELNHTLAKAYGGEDRLLMCLGSQRASLYKEGLCYIPKKGKTAFANHKTSFVWNNCQYCKSCKQVGHIEQQCMNKNKNAKVFSIKLDSFYVLTKGTNGVHAKFISAPWMGSKKKSIWVPKSLVTNLQGPKQVWVPKKN
jgi:cell division septum initiation protein DivIVA